jgi:hypothetical protein
VNGQRLLTPARRAQVTILSHKACLAQAFQIQLEASIAGIHGADPRALTWATGSQAQAAQGASVCLLLAWDSAGASTTQAAAQLADLQAHQQLRQDLQAQGLTFAVLRGAPAQQVQQALAALSRLQPALKPAGAQTLPRPGWLAACQTCDEPECEHRLLTGLLKSD